MKSLLQLPIGTVAATVLALAVGGTVRASDYYPSVVLHDHPLVYYTMNDAAPPDVATNSGSLGSTGNGLYLGAEHRVTGALASDPNPAAGFDGSGIRVTVPFTSSLNPAAAQPFSVEAWVLPTVDGAIPAQAPLSNLNSAGNRGWAFFQEYSGTGFSFQMFNQNAFLPSINITGGTYAVGQWTHLVAVWNGSTATFYVNGVSVGSQAGAYAPNTDSPLSVGAFATNSSGGNPFTGSIDEVAFYPTALSATKVANHYATALNGSPATPYGTVVINDGAAEYLRLDEPSVAYNAAVNAGRIGPSGDGFHSPGAVHGVPGAIVGSSDTAIHYSAIDTNSDDGGVPTIIPYNPALNTGGSFTIEGWVRPAEPGNGNAQCPFFNRDPNDGNAPNRAGWDTFQRDAGTGWNFRMFNSIGHDKAFNITGGSYTVGQWCHLVAVYNADVPSATLYVNGVQVATQVGSSEGSYTPTTYAPLSIGGYSDGSQNPFVGDIDEFAFYTNALTGAQVLAHYQNGINPSRTIPYSNLVVSNGAAEYLHLNEPYRAVLANSGTLGASLNGTYGNTTNDVAGLQPPADAGFDTNNLATYFDGNISYLELGNPAGLNFNGPITLEAWILPDASQNYEGYIIAHGDNDDESGYVNLAISSGYYQIGSTGAFASAAIPGNDLGGGQWVYLAGTWDGTNWNLFRNGVLIATQADSAGPSPIPNANWAIGARGKWKYAMGYPASGQTDVFTGSIDDPAIYNVALTPDQILAHYSAGAYGINPLAISVSGGNATLTWSAGTLQQASSLTGPWVSLPAATSPYVVPVVNTTQQFYRLGF